ncbi:hypothetical protein HPB52_007300 [Rhipicephalus sanguineus]|uniref:Uncharacterized protein n=1 Tax=Rhipicephalus sanguineus TaxID=34632 RepID=A0A9D4T2Y2_RHISA|nr:hypothetical protein HPB52_007300 [Rhipicephalus sanguineus]
MTGTHNLHLTPGEGQTPISLLFDEYAEELSFPQIYLDVPRQITGPRPTPFTKVSSEIRRTDHRGVGPEHVLYMATKVMRYNVSEKTMTFKTNADPSAFTRQQFETGGREFLDDVLNRNLAFVRGIHNTVQYWQDRRKELFAMIRQLGQALGGTEFRFDRMTKFHAPRQKDDGAQSDEVEWRMQALTDRRTCVSR